MDERSKTAEAIDDLGAEILAIPTTIFKTVNTAIGKAGGSSRIWTIVGVVAGEYAIATQMGLEPLAALGASIGLAATGTGFIVYKSKQHIEEVKANGKKQPNKVTPKPVVAPVEVGHKPTPVSIPTSTLYEVPIVPASYKNTARTAYLRWEEYEDLLSRPVLHNYTPNVRKEWINAVILEAFKRLDAAWVEALVNAGVTAEEVIYPGSNDYSITYLDDPKSRSYDLSEIFKAKLVELLPANCSPLSTQVRNITDLAIAYAKMYDLGEAFHQVQSKPIDWNKVARVDDIRRKGLGVVL